MRMYLSSFRNGNKPDELLRLLGDGRRAALILNAQDWKAPEDRATDLAQEVERLESIGLQPEETDLRQYFGRPDELRQALVGYDLIWVRGGNVFVLRRAFRRSGADSVIPELVNGDAIVYGGYSAGVDIMQPHLHGIELVDDPSVIPEGYDEEIIWDCPGLIPYCVAPHYKSDHPESADIDKVVSYYIDNHIPFVALRDGEVIVVDGDEQKFVG
ncbi:Type 1 glutamine amidotransferase-like domain-containing protein [Parafrankia discariae]|uniref:Type 1 glutamine amidotransferase-like domain-containing protein n=1 Tax=Parafrankia discariae TaxID=365528 RepID=UPI0004784285|nr:Type 1 glutamine amidotransferase-like domain-containing protein [Parafrankia discariae]